VWTPAQRAIFVETSLTSISPQALCTTRRNIAPRSGPVAVPYETLHELASVVAVDPWRLIFITLLAAVVRRFVSHLLNQAMGVVSLSEPDVYTQLVTRRTADGSHDSELRALVRSCTQVICASIARSHGTWAWALKFRSFVIELGDLLYDNFPEAKVIFLYRHAEPWARSMARAFHVFDPEIEPLLSALQPLFPRGIPAVAVHTVKDPARLSPLALVTYLWVSVMERCLDLQRQGVPMFVARYEDLHVAPHVVLDALLAYCQVPARDVGGIDRVLAQDSQAGTSLSREDVQASTTELGAQHVADMHRLMRAYSPILTPNLLCPRPFVSTLGERAGRTRFIHLSSEDGGVLQTVAPHLDHRIPCSAVGY
jgi:hypothetical protein